MQQTDDEFDVIILGAGIAGTMMGAILARHGHRVLLVDAGSHPRFALGESTTPYTLTVLRLLARRYDVPEIDALTSYANCVERIGPTSGIKEHFGFMFHHEGREPDPRETSGFIRPAVHVPLPHLFRQDVDSYLFHAAIRYGCVARQYFRVVDIDISDDGVEIVEAKGGRYRGKFLIDAAGFRSPIADKLGLREEPCRFEHHSRCLFTHMIDVKTTDECVPVGPADQPPVPWHLGTTHHMFDRGWFWIIPFNNDARSRNQLVSVGLTLDPRKYPKPADLTPEEEFRHHVDRFPAVARIFADAKSVREWVSTDRLQYSSRQTVGARWCMMSHAAGAIDALYSRGMSATGEVINALAWRLLDALRRDEFTDGWFAPIETLQQGILDWNDRVVTASFTGFSTDWRLWTAIFRVWAFGQIPGGMRLEQLATKFLSTGEEKWMRAIEDVPYPGLWWPDHPGYTELLEEALSQCAAVENGSVSAEAAADKLQALIEEADFIPPGLGFKENERFIHPTRGRLIRLMRWAFRSAPPEMRALVGGTALGTLRAKVTGKGGEMSHSYKAGGTKK